MYKVAASHSKQVIVDTSIYAFINIFNNNPLKFTDHYFENLLKIIDAETQSYLMRRSFN